MFGKNLTKFYKRFKDGISCEDILKNLLNRGSFNILLLRLQYFQWDAR